jgi:hypothetical protein
MLILSAAWTEVGKRNIVINATKNLLWNTPRPGILIEPLGSCQVEMRSKEISLIRRRFLFMMGARAPGIFGG